MKLMELYPDKMVGAIKGLDRIRFRGTRRWRATRSGLRTFMGHTHIWLKDFSRWVNGLTGLIRDRAEQRARGRARWTGVHCTPYLFLAIFASL
jgi:hypothetical protein